MIPGGGEARLPIIQKSAPCTRPAGATAVRNITSAEQNALTTTPERISAVGGSAPAPEARRQTAATAARAPQQAAAGTISGTPAAAPVVRTNTAPSAAPPETPSR